MAGVINLMVIIFHLWPAIKEQNKIRLNSTNPWNRFWILTVITNTETPYWSTWNSTVYTTWAHSTENILSTIASITLDSKFKKWLCTITKKLQRRKVFRGSETVLWISNSGDRRLWWEAVEEARLTFFLNSSLLRLVKIILWDWEIHRM